MRNDSVHSLFQYSSCSRLVFLILLVVYFRQIVFSQHIDSTTTSNRNTLQSEITRKQPQVTHPSSFMLLPFRNSIQSRMNHTIGPLSIEQLLEKHPELNDVILKEFIRIHLVNDKELAQQLKLYTPPASFLEREARLNMSRYGVPYNPLRPALLRTSFGPALF